jgi:hypothetical protein
VGDGTLIEPEARLARVDDLAEMLLRDYRINRRKSIEHTERRWRKHLQPFFGGRRVVDVTSAV